MWEAGVIAYFMTNCLKMLRSDFGNMLPNSRALKIYGLRATTEDMNAATSPYLPNSA